MPRKILIAFSFAFFLAGCGTLNVHIELGDTPVSSPTPASLEAAGATPAPSATPSKTPEPGGPPFNSPTDEGQIPQGIQVVDLAANRDHTCAVTDAGGVKCWGNNEHGQLGNGTIVSSSLPVDVSGVTDTVAVTAGWGHACALTAGGGVKCWGYNANGELGNGRTADSAVPVDVQGLESGAVAVDAGDDHTCAVTEDGGLKCWGWNDYGQLGDWTKDARSIPVASPFFGGGVADVAAGWGHTCVRTAEGWAKCWGNNEYGQLGFGKTTDIHLPAADVVNLSGRVLQVTADGGQTCALTAGGGAQCWGNNRYGQLGDGANQKKYEPVPVQGLASGVGRIEAGWNHTCASAGGGELLCWGWNYFGQLGDGTTLNRNTPARVRHLTDGVVEIALGWAHTCVLSELGAVKCWGANSSGQLGDGTVKDSAVPLAVVGLPGAGGSASERTVAPSPTGRETERPTPAATATHTPPPEVSRALAVSVNSTFTCALMSCGAVNCWGDNTYGGLGDGTVHDSALPVAVQGLRGDIAAIAVGSAHACALRTDGAMQCWGKNTSGQLGGGFVSNGSNTPVDVVVLDGEINAMALGSDYTCVLTAAGGVKCWGWNHSGQLGDGTNVESRTPVDVVGLSGGVIAVSARLSTTCALLEGGSVECWGGMVGEPSGDGAPADSNVPLPIKGLSSGMTSISAGWFHACALTAGGGAKCWGGNNYGQLGIGTKSLWEFPADVVEPADDFLDIRVGNAFTCARTKARGVKCWGSVNEARLFEAPSFTDQPLPLEVGGLSGGVASLDVGWGYACVITTDGDVMCWGSNRDGQLGDGTHTDRMAPGVVVEL
ncbi:MAG: hypothetical protein JW929_09460 [Anaerolineales bacterium]|nr:hypothetical protein [Anaerolineales bacterium]